MNRVNWDGASYKEWIGLLASPVFWIASIVCFIFGLNFSQGSGIYIPGTNTDILIFFSFGLGLANTAIQIVGNDSTKEELGMPLFLMWIASYMLGVGSNVNYLYVVIGLSNPFLQFLVCGGLGVMIEVAPERLLVRFLRSVGILGKVKTQYNTPKTYPSQNQHQGNETRKVSPPQPTHDVYPRQMPKPRQEPRYNNTESRPETTYHPVSLREPQDIPPFLRERERE